MISLEKLRTFFTKPAGEEDKILKLLEKVLLKIDKKKKGILIGTKKHVDYKKLLTDTVFPAGISSEEEVVEYIISLYEGVTLWGHPQIQMNVVPPATTISIVMAALAARFNENSIWDHYGMSAAQSEVAAIGMLADLIGFDKTKAGGLFTFGGTGCNLYAARIGIEKSNPRAKNRGLREVTHFFCSDVSHYSIKSAAMWTGVGFDNVRIVPSDDDNVMIVSELEKGINESLRSGARIGAVFATMGTTDAFGIDPLKEIVSLRDRIQEKVGYKIHIHADAVIGWSYLTFKGDKNILQFSKPLQDELRFIISKITELKYADSVGVDFHKTGWGPYLCSAFIVKNHDDLLLLEKKKADSPYLYHDDGYQPGLFSLECSRPNYAQKALANMMLLGKEGYETLIAHLLSVADYLREKMKARGDVEILNRHNPAFVTDFRLYPPGVWKSDELSLFEQELHGLVDGEFTDSVNDYNLKIVKRLIENAEQEGGTIISYTDSYKLRKDGKGIVALKSYPMSPFIDNHSMDMLLENLLQAKVSVDREGD